MPLLVSPFSPILESYGATLPPALREQFLLSPEMPYTLVLRGRMDRIWHRPRWIWPMLWLLAQVDALFPEEGEAVSASLAITAGRDEHDLPYQDWRRRFEFIPPRYFNAVTTYDWHLQQVQEWLEPGQMLCITWNVTFCPPATIKIETLSFTLNLGWLRLRLPDWLVARVCAIETADLSCADTIRIDLKVIHPWLGAIFGYEGNFQIERQWKLSQ